MTPSKLMKEWQDRRTEYFEAVDRRDEEVRSGVLVSEPFKDFEKRMNTRLNRLRARLAQKFPEMFHFGRKTRNKDVNGAKKQKVCVQGDHGFWICPECNQTFEFVAKVDGDSCSRHTFLNCKEHKGRKAVGKMSLKPVLDWCL